MNQIETKNVFHVNGCAWSFKRVNRLVEIINGFPFDSNFFDLYDGYPLVKIRDIGKNSSSVFYNGFWIERASINGDDLLISMDGDFYLGRWKGKERALLNQRVCCLRSKNKININYLEFCLPHQLNKINEITYSTTVKHISSSQISKIKIFIPESENCKTKIVNFLNQKINKIEQSLNLLNNFIQKLQEQRTAIITQTVTRGLPPEAARAAGLEPHTEFKPSGVDELGELPATWRTIKMKFVISKIEQGWSPLAEGRPAEENEWGVLKVGCVNEFDFNEFENKKLPDDLLFDIKYQIKKLDFLVSRANSKNFVGSASIVNQIKSNLILCDKLYRIKFKSLVNYKFMFYLFRSNFLRNIFETCSTGASDSMQNISQELILNICFGLPSLIEQESIVNFLNKRVEKIHCLINDSKKMIARLQEYRTALITAAVTGQVDVRGWSDESAIDGTGV